MSSHAFTGPGEVEPNAFQRALLTAMAYFEARYRRVWGRAPAYHERSTMSLVDLVHGEAAGNLEHARALIDELFIQGLATGDSLHECWVRREWWRETGRPEVPGSIPPKRRELLEGEIHDRATIALQLERKREERVRRGA